MAFETFDFQIQRKPRDEKRSGIGLRLLAVENWRFVSIGRRRAVDFGLVQTLDSIAINR